MQVLRSLPELSVFLHINECKPGCFADTGFLYGLAYDDDRIFAPANDVLDILGRSQIPIYTNVISRLELIDLILRKQITAGCIEMFNETKAPSHSKPIFKLLKDIRDKDTAAQNKKESYKIDEYRLKKLRKHVDVEYGIKDWDEFCAKYVGTMLTNEWQMLEQDFGLNFVEVMEGQTSPLFRSPLYWKDMVAVMGQHGQRGPDAMIVNLFAKSHFPLLITADSDIEYCFTDPLQNFSNKAIYVLQ
jgi:predicted nucleic acid-binding protein